MGTSSSCMAPRRRSPRWTPTRSSRRGTVATRGAGDLDPAGERLATCHTDGRVRVWNARTAALLGEIDHPAACTGVRWFPDGSALLGWNDAGTLVELPAP